MTSIQPRTSPLKFARFPCTDRIITDRIIAACFPFETQSGSLLRLLLKTGSLLQTRWPGHRHLLALPQHLDELVEARGPQRGPRDARREEHARGPGRCGGGVGRVASAGTLLAKLAKQFCNFAILQFYNFPRFETTLIVQHFFEIYKCI